MDLSAAEDQIDFEHWLLRLMEGRLEKREETGLAVLMFTRGWLAH